MKDSEGRTHLDPTAVGRRLDMELGEVRAAILLVASGSASRVVVTGLTFGDVVGAHLKGEAARRHVALSPEYRPDDDGCDLTVVARDDH
jgi:hypothetical protein